MADADENGAAPRLVSRGASVSDSASNRRSSARSEAAWRELLQFGQTRGFHGTVSIEVALQDGTIQHIRRRVDQLSK